MGITAIQDEDSYPVVKRAVWSDLRVSFFPPQWGAKELRLEFPSHRIVVYWFIMQGISLDVIRKKRVEDVCISCHSFFIKIPVKCGDFSMISPVNGHDALNHLMEWSFFGMVGIWPWAFLGPKSECLGVIINGTAKLIWIYKLDHKLAKHGIDVIGYATHIWAFSEARLKKSQWHWDPEGNLYEIYLSFFGHPFSRSLSQDVTKMGGRLQMLQAHHHVSGPACSVRAQIWPLKRDYPRHCKLFKHPCGEGMFTSLPDDLGKLCASWPTHFEKNPVVTHQLFELYRLPNPENAPRKLSPEILGSSPTSPIIPLPTCNWWSTPSHHRAPF